MDPAVQQFLLAGPPVGVAMAIAMTAVWWRSGRADGAWRGLAHTTTGDDPSLTRAGSAHSAPDPQSAGPRWAFPLFSGVAVLAMFPVLFNERLWPPADAFTHLPLVVLVATLGGLVASRRSSSGRVSVLVVGALGAGLAWLALRTIIGAQGWSVWQASAWIVGTGVASALIRCSVARQGLARTGPGLPAALWLWGALVGQVMALDMGILKGGVMATLLAATWGGAMVAALLRPRLSLGASAGALAALAMPVLMLIAMVTTDTPRGIAFFYAGCALAGPLLGGLVDLPVLARLTGRRGLTRELLRVALFAGPVAVAAGIAAWRFMAAAEAARELGY
jgi:hypothetical protein